MGQVLLLIFAALGLFVGGAALGYWFAAMGRERSRADALQQELDNYRRRVNQHFAATAEHFQTIGREYQALYNHMASGAEALCDPREAGHRLSFAPAPIDTESAGPSDGEDPAPAEAGNGKDEKSAEATEEPDADRVALSGDDREAGGDAARQAADDDDGTTPESRARGAGGESAPTEDDAEDEIEAAADEADEADEKEPATVEKAAPKPGEGDKGGEGDRTYH